MYLNHFHRFVKRCLLHIKLFHRLNGADIAAHPFGDDIAKLSGIVKEGLPKRLPAI